MATGIPKTKFKNLNNTCKIELSYLGKKDESSILEYPLTKIEKIWSGSAEFNRLYFGENLGILSNLLIDKDVAGKVKVVYIDPPFSCNASFHSRKLIHAYDDILEGSEFIEFLRERLYFLKELLAEDGSIYLHLDERMAFYFKIVLDEVFGKKNFKNFIVRKKCNPKNYTRKRYGNISDYILFYTKTENYIWNRPYNPWSTEQIKKEYQYIEEGTGRRYKKVPIHAPGTRNGETGKSWRGLLPPPGKHWQYTPEKLEDLDKRGEIYWSSNGNPRKKIYLDESGGIPIQDIWLDMLDPHNQNIDITGYPTEKNPNVLERIINTSSNPGDIILDCFAGSGTTLFVASKLKRKWIGIDNSNEAITTILKRFFKGLEPMGDFVSLRNEKKNELENLKLPFLNEEEVFNQQHEQIKDFILYGIDGNEENREIIKELKKLEAE